MLKLLDFLFDRWSAGDHRELPESDLHPLVFPAQRTPGKREPGSNTYGVNAFRPAVGDLRSVLRRWAASSEGKAFPVHIEMPDGIHILKFRPTDSLVKRFWSPYLTDTEGRKVLIVYPENVFYRSMKGRYLIRHLDSNDERDDPTKGCDFLRPEHLPLQPARHFASAGDTAALLYLTRWFERVGTEVEFDVAYQRNNYQSLSGWNLVLAGNLRTFSFLYKLVAGHNFNFRVESDHILSLDPDEEDVPGEHPKNIEAPLKYNRQMKESSRVYEDDFTAPGSVRGVIYRMEDHALGGWVTIISSNSGRFHEAIAHYLVSEKSVGDLLNALGASSGDVKLKKFEVLFEVAIDEYERSTRPVYHVTLLGKRVWEVESRADRELEKRASMHP